MESSVKPSQLLLLGAGALLVLASFLDFLTPSLSAEEVSDDQVAVQATSTAWDQVGLMVVPALIGTVVVIGTGRRAFGSTPAPATSLPLDWNQLVATLSATAVLVVVGLAFYSPFAMSYDRGPGFWMTAVGAVGILAGAVMALRDGDQAPRPTTEPTTF